MSAISESGSVADAALADEMTDRPGELPRPSIAVTPTVTADASAQEELAKKRPTQSLLSETARRKTSILISGHSNLPNASKSKIKVRLHSDAVRVEDHIQLHHMVQLKDKWQEHGLSLDKTQFRDVIWDVFGSALGDMFEVHTSFLFKKMDTNQDQEVDWDEFCTYMMIGLQEKDELACERETPLMLCHEIFNQVHKAKIVRIQSLAAPTRFVSISEDGVCATYNMKMQVTAQLQLDELQFQEMKSLRVTDGLFMTNAYRIVMATTARDLRFYHSSTGNILNKVDVFNIVMCFDYVFDLDTPDEATLICGDIAGNATLLKFTQATSVLFATRANSWQEDGRLSVQDCIEAGNDELTSESPVYELSKLCTADFYEVHEEEGANMLNQAILKIKFIPSMEAFITITSTSNTAMVVFDVSCGTTIGVPRVFAIPKGCKCFDFSEELNLIATGGADNLIRLFNPYVQQHPRHMLIGHRTPVVQLAFNAAYGQVMSIADNEVIKIWSIAEQVCLNTLGGVIPHTMTYSSPVVGQLVWHAASQSALICSGTELAVVQLLRDETLTSSKTAHDMPITCAAYIPEFQMFATGCSGGTINTWELQTGNKVLEFSNAHQHAAISCLAVGYGGRRLISGASNGDIFIWAILSGIVLQKLVKKEPKEVTGIFTTKSHIYSIGWDARLIRFNDDEEVDITRAPMIMHQQSGFDPVVCHRDDVLTMDQCGGILVATGSFDGQIIVWNVKLAKAAKTFDSASFRKRWRVKKCRSAASSEPDHFPEVAVTAKRAVEKLIWLKERVKLSSRGKHNVATLVASCDGGCIVFWNALKGDMLLAFYAVTNEHGIEGVNGLAVDSKNERLFTGDTLGNVRVWDIAFTCLDGVDGQKPRMIREWAAHVQGITALQLVEDSGVVVTSSADCSVRVWGMSDSHFIGAFGGKTMWSLSVLDYVKQVSDERLQESQQPSDGGVNGNTGTRRYTMHAADMMGMQIDRSTRRVGSDMQLVVPGMSSVQLPGIGQLAPTSTLMEESGCLEGGGEEGNGSDENDVASAEALKQMSLRPEREDMDDAATQLLSGVEAVSRFGGAITKMTPITRLQNVTLLGASKSPTFEWERPSVLGKAFTKKAKTTFDARKQWRDTTTLSDTESTTIKGLHICVPYNSLKLTALTDVETQREPSAIGRMRTRDDDDDDDDGRPARRGRGFNKRNMLPSIKSHAK